jgi:hypothetical protein
MSGNDNNVTKERHRWTKAERQYIKGIVHNYSLQRWTDQDIVDYLWNEKKIEIARSTVTTIKNKVVEEAGDWYIALRQSGTKYVAVYKERLDSLLSYQKKLHEIMASSEVPEIRIRAIAELHRIEMSIFSLFKELPQFEIKPDSKDINKIKNCRCADTIIHCKCKYCKEAWCPAALGQDWCPNPDCSQGIKGSNFEPWDEHNKWIKCPTCEMWFKNSDILAVHNCYIKVNPGIGDDDNLPGPGIGGEGAGPRVEEPSTSNEPEPGPITITSPSSPIEEQEQKEQELESTEEEEPEESEADIYWRTHPARVRPHNNNKVKFVVE